MKHLIALTILFAACHPVRNMQVSIPETYKGYGLKDTLCIYNGTSVYKIPIYTPFALFSTEDKIDTIHEVMFISTRVPGIGVAHYGLAIVRNGICITHMDCHGHVLKPSVYVWSCETERKRRGQ
jgi:hypothetical protein